MIKEAFYDIVQERLVQVEDLMRSQSNGHNPELEAAMLHLLSSGGKRIRVAMTLLAGNLFCAEPERLVTLAAAIELLHTATLVHDDLIDGSLIRRGIPTLNSQWTPAATVLTGDFIFAQAAKLAAETNSIAIMKLFAETLATIVNGEINQLFYSQGVASRVDYDRRIYAKTASLFETASKSAALLSQADNHLVHRMSEYGYNVGMAFQIVDDVLDFTGEQATLGKPVASDLRQGLITLPALYYLENHPDDLDMRAILANRICGEKCMDRLLASIRRSGAIQMAMKEARRLVELGIAALAGLPDNAARGGLEELGRYIVNRNL